MLDELWDAACYLDWISPLWDIGNDLAHGKDHTLLIDEHCGWSQRQVKAVLRKNGITAWGKTTVNGQQMVMVKRDQAEQALKALAANGLPMTGEPPKRSQAQRGQPRRGRSRLWSLLP